MGKTYTETKLGDELDITIRRTRDDEGVLGWSLVVEATVLDQAGSPTRRLALRNLKDQLTATQKTSLVGLANAILTRLATALAVAES